MFNVTRLELARKRRRLTAKSLAEAASISPVTLSRITNGQQIADESTVDALIGALGFPREFFFQDDVDAIDSTAASFRSLTAITAREREAALAAGSLAFEMADWVAERYNLPDAEILDLSQERDPAAAARAVRQSWAIGERPIASMVKLLEAKGVRVFSLAENTKNVDAFSCWRNGIPYVFLNTFKTAERSRFDAAHELAHLVLHKHGGPQQGRQAEWEAQRFASAFLMPEDDVRASLPRVSNLQQIVKAKSRWGVSASALAYRLHKLGMLTDWQYRTFAIQINRNYGTSEPNGLPPERSSVWHAVLTDLWKTGMSRNQLASVLKLPHDEVENLLFGLAGEEVRVERAIGRPDLRQV